jgi:predicted ArsR family transcriptional regulator
VTSERERQLERCTVLADPTRRGVYGWVREAHRPVTREDVAAGTGLSRSLAAFHLERLLEAGLVSADYARPPGRSGPGAGRPAKRYVPSAVELAIEIPPRSYALAGRLLARAVDRAAAPGSARDEVMRVAATEGRALGTAATTPDEPTDEGERATLLDRVLVDLGFEPVADEAGEILLANCPFHALTEVATDLVCGMNAALLGGVLDGLGRDDLEARLQPAEGRCCVVVSAAGDPGRRRTQRRAAGDDRG